MKVCQQCYKDAFKETSMKIILSGHLTSGRVIPSCEDTYKQRCKVEEISSFKAAHLQQMYDTFVPEECHPNWLCTLIMYLPNDAYYATLVARSVTLRNILLCAMSIYELVY